MAGLHYAASALALFQQALDLIKFDRGHQRFGRRHRLKERLRGLGRLWVPARKARWEDHVAKCRLPSPSNRSFRFPNPWEPGKCPPGRGGRSWSGRDRCAPRRRASGASSGRAFVRCSAFQPRGLAAPSWRGGFHKVLDSGKGERDKRLAGNSFFGKSDS